LLPRPDWTETSWTEATLLRHKKRVGSALAVFVAFAIVLIALGGLVYGVVEDSAAVGPLTAAAVLIGVPIYSDIGKRATS
jgi:hypothetical protein